jgi:hypothetical protein
MARFQIFNEVSKPAKEEKDVWKLYFQQGKYIYDNDESEEGYRFIWRRPDGTLQAARGQARIPNKKELLELLDLASVEGWFNEEK